MLLKVLASNYNTEILNSFNPEVQLKDTESAIKSKLIKLLAFKLAQIKVLNS